MARQLQSGRSIIQKLADSEDIFTAWHLDLQILAWTTCTGMLRLVACIHGHMTSASKDGIMLFMLICRLPTMPAIS